MAEEVKIGKWSEIPEGKIKVFNINRESIAVSKINGNIYAFKNECTHMEFPLAKGLINGETITCPAHGARFNLKTGEVLSLPAAHPLKIYKVRNDGDDIIIELD